MKIIEALSILKNNCAAQLDSIRVETKLTPAEFNGIISIERKQKLTCQDLSTKMGLSASRGSRVINKLISKGYLKEEKHKIDKRCNLISLSPNGIRLKNKIDELLNDCEKKIKSKLTKDELNSVISSLEKLIKVL